MDIAAGPPWRDRPPPSPDQSIRDVRIWPTDGLRLTHVYVGGDARAETEGQSVTIIEQPDSFEVQVSDGTTVRRLSVR